MAQKKPAAKKAATKKPARARNKDGTYKGDDKSTPDVNEAYEKPKPGTKATTKPRNPAAKQREAAAPKKPAAKKPAQKKPHTYAPKVKSPVEELLDTPPPTLSRYEPPVKKKSRAARIWGWFVGE